MIDKNDEQSIRKEFNLWNRVKTELQLYGRKPKISNGQIWWAGVGKNAGRKQIAVVGDAKTISVKRLYRMIGKIDDTDYEYIRQGFMRLYQ